MKTLTLWLLRSNTVFYLKKKKRGNEQHFFHYLDLVSVWVQALAAAFGTPIEFGPLLLRVLNFRVITIGGMWRQREPMWDIPLPEIEYPVELQCYLVEVAMLAWGCYVGWRHLLKWRGRWGSQSHLSVTYTLSPGLTREYGY